MAREPGYCLHKPTGQAYVRFNGKLYYLGEYGTDESKRKYEQLKAEWLVNRHSAKYSPQLIGPTVADVCLAFLDHAECYYPKEGDEYDSYRYAMVPLSELYAKLPARDFGVVEFRTVREWLLNTPIDRTKVRQSSTKSARTKPAKQDDKKPKATAKAPEYRSRQYINKQMKRLIRIFRWAAGEGMIPPTVADTLRCVDPLKRGRTQAREAEPVKPVSPTLVESTLRHLTPVLRDMVRFQQYTGCRPGEVCKITPAMVDRSGDVWEIKLTEHKTAHRGKERTIYVGPQAQAVLMPYLLRPADAFCFSPQESERQRLQAKHEARVTPLSYGNRPGTNKLARKPRQAPGVFYTTSSYTKAIKYACQRAKLEHWHPNQLRHLAATEIRRQFGIEAASTILGHSGLEVTQVYAEADRQKAKAVAMRIG